MLQSKERRTWQKERDRLVAEQKAIEEEMANFVAIHEGEINALLQEYWTMRKQAGTSNDVWWWRDAALTARGLYEHRHGEARVKARRNAGLSSVSVPVSAARCGLLYSGH